MQIGVILIQRAAAEAVTAAAAAAEDSACKPSIEIYKTNTRQIYYKRQQKNPEEKTN